MNTRHQLPAADGRGVRNPFEILSRRGIEACEKRLVLSGQWVCEGLVQPDAFGPAFPASSGLQDSSLMELGRHFELEPIGPLEDAHVLQGIEPHLASAHQATGWAAAREQFGLTGAGQTVAIIDSGIAWDHESLGRGYGPGYRVVGGWDFAENDASPYDDGPAGFHGTHVSGIVASDDPRHPGVAPGVDLVGLRVFNDFGQGRLAWVEQALTWVYQNRNTFENPITTVNLSLGANWNADVVPPWATLENELQQLSGAGIAVIVSAGNSFQQFLEPGLSYPAASPYVLPVASLDGHGELSDFSQRSSEVLAAPGERILSTVPDYFLGRDGRSNDFSTSSGTSMAAPYVAGASALVRQAMELVGIQSIHLSTIEQHLRSTADTIFDAATGGYYKSLNLGAAIDALIPEDVVGNTISNAGTLHLTEDVQGWINDVNDRDVYRFSTDVAGMLDLQATSQWASNLQWQVSSQGELIADSSSSEAISISPGVSYVLTVQSPGSIGAFTLDINFTANSNGGNGEGISTPAESLGRVDYHEQTAQAGTAYRAQAANDGIFSLQWESASPRGSLSLIAGTTTVHDSTWTDGMLRLDASVKAGEWVEFVVPGVAGSSGELRLANLVQQVGSQLLVRGTEAADEWMLNLQTGIELTIGEIEYQFANDSIHTIQVDGAGNNDRLSIVGSSLSEKLELDPQGSSLANSRLNASFAGIEEISFQGGGGADRTYLYDSNTNDTLTARPRTALLQGVGYRFQVEHVDRIFVHATGHGEDIAYLHDSQGDDRLSVRPQFMSMAGDNYFNYVRGFERVYAYASAGGHDSASLYDSSSNDRFMTNGIAASIVGPGFASYTRGFEVVTAHATAGGQDVAALYAADAEASWRVGPDQVALQDQNWTREAQGFESYEAYVAGQSRPLTPAATILSDQDRWSDWLVESAPMPLDNYIESAEAEFETLDALFAEQGSAE